MMSLVWHHTVKQACTHHGYLKALTYVEHHYARKYEHNRPDVGIILVGVSAFLVHQHLEVTKMSTQYVLITKLRHHVIAEALEINTGSVIGAIVRLRPSLANESVYN